MESKKMLTHSLPAILTDDHFRAGEATRVAYEIVIAESQEVQKPIARYGQFVDLQQPVLPVAMKDFYRALGGLRIYQETVAPLRGYERQHDDFDNKMALAVYRLLKK
jgi:hypothetical protein